MKKKKTKNIEGLTNDQLEEEEEDRGGEDYKKLGSNQADKITVNEN